MSIKLRKHNYVNENKHGEKHPARVEGLGLEAGECEGLAQQLRRYKARNLGNYRLTLPYYLIQ